MTGKFNMPGSEVGVPDKMTVFQRCVSGFNRSGLPAEEARSLLTQLVHLFYVGDSFMESEATQLFFTITKLFQKESAGLKQMIYLAIKELVPLTDNVIMGTSVLMRDVQQSHSSAEAALYRPQALRALCRILDAGAVEGMDRLMRTAIVDKDESVSSAALVSSYHLLGIARDSVKRWATEIQEACGSSNISQYHALGLLHEVRRHDPMALLKLVVSLAEQNKIVDANAQALHIRYVGELLVDQPNQPQLLHILKSYLHNRSDIVALEAAKAALIVPNANDELVSSAVGVLRAYLESPRATSRFAAIRALNRFAGVRPEIISACNDEIEQLITDSNQSIATYAITALLKTGSESSVDSLIDRISNILRDIPDDFKLVVVDAVRSLAKRFPTKHDKMLDFLADTLQHHGHFELKLALVEAISDVLHADSASDSLNNALMMLCETIEDSEYPEVTIRVLHLLGSAGPSASKPSTYVRFIYNRVILENSVVRAAAISALSKFADVVPGARRLIDRSLKDPNDEVRDRASIAFIAEVSTLPNRKMAMDDLESKLMAYLSDVESLSKPFDASKVQLITDEERLKTRIVTEVSVAAEEELTANNKHGRSQGPAIGSAGSAESSTAPEVDFSAQFNDIPEIAALGKLLHTGSTQKLTDEDLEYVVKARTHMFENHILLQYDIQNNYELNLTDLTVETSLDPGLEEQLESKFVIPIASLGANAANSTYVAFERNGLSLGYIGSTLRFHVDGDQDEYPIDDLELRPADYIRLGATSGPGEHEALWQEPNLFEEKATSQLKSCSSLSDAAVYLQTQLGMSNCGSIPLETDTSVNLLLKGESAVSHKPVLVKAQLIKSSRAGIAGRFTVRSEDEEAAVLVADGI